jgi:hypothetical protein
MKSLKTPNVFGPDQVLDSERLNKNFHHFEVEISNIAEKRYTYSSLKIPLAFYSDSTVIGSNPMGGSAEPCVRPVSGTPGWTPRPLSGTNVEALRMFSFVPPVNMRVTRAEFVCMSPVENELTVSFFVDQGGEGYPPRPESILPDGFISPKNPNEEPYHKILSLSIDAAQADTYMTAVSNDEYFLEKGKCYRVALQDHQAEYLKYAQLELTLQVDRYQQLVDFASEAQGYEVVPALNFLNASDKVTKETLEENLNQIRDRLFQSPLGVATNGETFLWQRTIKPEVYHFGLGSMSGKWRRPQGVSTPADPALTTFASATAGSIATVSEIYDDTVFKFISDMEMFYFNDTASYSWDTPSFRTYITERAIDFYDNLLARAPMAPPGYSRPEASSLLGYGPYMNDLSKKKIIGYSIGYMHNSSYHHCMFENTDQSYHYGVEGMGALNHGLAPGDRIDNPVNKPQLDGVTGGANYQHAYVWGPSVGVLNQPNDNLVAIKISDGDGSNPVGFQNQRQAGSQTPWFATTVPNLNSKADTFTDPTLSIIDSQSTFTGRASGFPGEYLAELHSAEVFSYDQESGALYNSCENNQDLSTTSSNFANPKEPRLPPGTPAKVSEILADIFVQILTSLPNSGRMENPADIDGALLYRHLQKAYVLLWVA